MNPNRRFLTSNRHETFLAELIAVGGNWDVLVSHPNECLDWNPNRSAVPTNAKLIDWGSQGSGYDRIVVHTLRDLKLFWGKPNIILIIHIALLWRTPMDMIKSIVKIVWLKLFLFWHAGTRVVFVSEWKKSTWIFFNKEQVIPLCVPHLDKWISSKSYERVQCVVVGNEFSKRKELNFPLVQRLYEQFQSRCDLSMFGLNPDIPYSKTLSRDAFLKELSKHNLFIFTTPLGYNDGYNTAMLEAMALGLPVLTLNHDSTPIQDGESGLVALSEDEMIKALDKIIQNPKALASMGEKARALVQRQFSQGAFQQNWRRFLKSLESPFSQVS